MTDWDTRDEMKAIVALGVIASLFVLFQAISLGQFPIVPRAGPAWIAPSENALEFFLFTSFGGYAASIAIALGLDYRDWERPVELFKAFADVMFTIGAFVILASVLFIFIRGFF